MAFRRLHRRLRDARRRLGDRAYARLAALWRDGVRACEEAEAERLFRRLAAWQAAEGAPLEAVLSRLPQGMALELRRAAAALQAEEDGKPHEPGPGKARGRR